MEVISNEYTVDHHLFALCVRYFKLIEPYLDENLGISLTSVFVDRMVRILTEKKTDFECLCLFLSEWIRLVPEKVGHIYELLGSFVIAQKIPFQSRLSITKDVVGILQNLKRDQQSGRLKDTFMKAASIFTNEAHLKQVLDFLPEVSKSVKFNEEDLCQLFSMPHIPIDERSRVIGQLAYGFKSQLNHLGQEFLASDYLALILTCELIDHTDKELSSALFRKLLRIPFES
jgi:hypothetical protein